MWWPELGMGWHPRPPIQYEGSYWEEYRRRDASAMGRSLTSARVDLVRRWWGQEVVDIGIGGGRFVEAAGGLGYDVNPEAIAWLRKKGRWCDVYEEPVEAITCWDSLEHIPDPRQLLAQVKRWLFVSLPIFDGPEDCLRSRHYKPGEHIWYWTHEGFIGWLEEQGFEMRDGSQIESELGRHGIMSYAFERVSEVVPQVGQAA